jgi:anti-sigma regulatory factor (Ser/Thr protein kinase)
MLDAADRAIRLEYPDKFVTAFVGVFDPIISTFTYASAGHPPPLLRRPDGSVEPLKETGLPLGLRSNAENTGSSTISLAPGSCLLLYTDGLTEFDRTPLSGERRLAEAWSEIADDPRDGPARRIVERLMNGTRARDDVAVLVLDIRTPFERDARGRELVQRWSLHTADERSVIASRRTFAGALREHGATSDDIAVAEIVFGELVSNAVRYAPGHVEIIVDWTGPDPVLHVLDRGKGFRHVSIVPPDLFSESGRGLFIVSALTHDFRISQRPGGGSHARAALRMQSRQLVNIRTDTLRNPRLHAFGDRVAIAVD